MLFDGKAKLEVSPTPGPKGTYETGTLVTMTIKELYSYHTVDWRGVLRVFGQSRLIATVKITEETFISVIFVPNYS